MASPMEPAASPGAARGSLWRRPTARPLAVMLAVLAALAVWGGSELVFGIDVQQPAFGTGPPQDLTAGPIVIASVVAGLAAWLALAVLERPGSPSRPLCWWRRSERRCPDAESTSRAGWC